MYRKCLGLYSDLFLPLECLLRLFKQDQTSLDKYRRGLNILVSPSKRSSLEYTSFYPGTSLLEESLLTFQEHALCLSLLELVLKVPPSVEQDPLCRSTFPSSVLKSSKQEYENLIDSSLSIHLVLYHN